MTFAKTAISLDRELLDEADKIAKKTKNSRSGVISLALKEYIARLHQEEVLSQLNDVYDDGLEEETELIDAGKDYFARQVIEPETW